MTERRQHESLMTGAEIESLFNDSTVKKLEQKHTELLAEMFTVQAEIKATDDYEAQELLREKLAELREQDRLTLEAMRKAQNKFPTIDQLKKSA